MNVPLQDRVGVLAEISQVLGQALDLKTALEAVLEILCRALALKKAAVTLQEAESGLSRLVACRGFTPEEQAKGLGPLTGAVRVPRPSQPLVILPGQQEPRLLKETESLPARGEISFHGIPIVLKDSSLGVLWVDRVRSGKAPVAEDRRFLEIVAGIMAQLVSLNRRVRDREEELRREIRTLRRELSEKTRHPLPAGKSPALAEVRQLLENLAARLNLMAAGKDIAFQDLASHLFSAAGQMGGREQTFPSRLKEMEKREILAALERNRWIQSQAAMDLGLTLRQMGYRVKQFGLEKLIKKHRGQGSRSRV